MVKKTGVGGKASTVCLVNLGKLLFGIRFLGEHPFAGDF